MLLRLWAQAVLEEQYENAKSLFVPFIDYALEAFIRGLPDRILAIVESQYIGSIT